VSGEEAWEAAKKRYPVGSAAQGRVKDRFPFGVFLELDDAPGVNGFVDLLSYNPDGTINDPEAPPVPLPEVGETVEGTVAMHVDRDRQIRVRVGAPFWES
jgi:ribosomal protein S1